MYPDHLIITSHFKEFLLFIKRLFATFEPLL